MPIELSRWSKKVIVVIRSSLSFRYSTTREINFQKIESSSSSSSSSSSPEKRAAYESRISPMFFNEIAGGKGKIDLEDPSVRHACYQERWVEETGLGCGKEFIAELRPMVFTNNDDNNDK